ncbi:MAG: CDP-alcohol phosphatidyltransferase family protein, partial [Desulfovibrio sp.]
MEPNMETPPRRGDTAKPVHKGVYLLPNLITSLSMFLGFLSMVWAVQGRIEHAAFAIFMSAIMDGLDGKV